MVQHLQQVEMAYLKADAIYAESGSTIGISVHTETIETCRTDKLGKICLLQIILQIQIATQIQLLILREIIPTNMYLPENQDFKESAITAESGDIVEKVAHFLEIINSEMLREPTYVCQYQRMYHKTELRKK